MELPNDEGLELSYVPQSPFEELAGFEVTASRSGRATEDAFMLRSGELIAGCMRERGWDYVPAVAGVGAIVPGATRPFANLESHITHAREVGYGVTAAVFSSPSPEPLNPNEAYVESLSDLERRAFQKDLFGTADRPGCTQLGLREAADELGMSSENQPLFDFEAEMEDILAADPRLVGAQRTWQACAAAVGYPGYANPGDIAARLFDEVSAEYQEDEVPEALLRIERELAEALAVCDFEYGQRQWAIRVDVEREFIEDNRKALEAAVLSLEES